MPKSIKSKEDIQKLKAIKQAIQEDFVALKTLKNDIKSLKAERKEINSKYAVQPAVVAEPTIM